MPEKQNTEDIFSGVEKETKTSVTQIEGQSIHTQRPEPKFKKRFNFSIIIKFLLVIIIFGSIVFGVWFLFFRKSSQIFKEIKTSVSEQGFFTTTTPAAIEVSPVLDADRDGLNDIEEEELGTDPENLDSDHDGLSDKEEVKIYLTDPLNQDTDGDGLKDGQEVKNNGDPKNSNPEARLFDLNKEIEKLR